jgi:hypothetical protein
MDNQNVQDMGAGVSSQSSKPFPVKLVAIIVGAIAVVVVIVLLLVLFVFDRDRGIDLLVGEWECEVSDMTGSVAISFEENGRFTENVNLSMDMSDGSIVAMNRGRFSVTNTSDDNTDGGSTKIVSAKLEIEEHELCIDANCFGGETGETGDAIVDYIFRDDNRDEFEVITEDSVMTCRRR